MPDFYPKVKKHHQKGSGCNIAIFTLALIVWGVYALIKPLVLDVLF